MILHIIIENKIATYQKRDGDIVCANSDYQIKFTFDSEWDAYTEKTARFKWNGSFIDVTFTDDTCAVPEIDNATECEVGVFAGDLCTTTPAVIGCKKSILCGAASPSTENDRYYANEAKAAAEEAKAAAEAAKNYAGGTAGGTTPGTTSSIPAYVDTEARRVAELVRAKNKPGNLVFIAASDIHVAADTSTTSAETFNTRAGVIDTGYGFAALQRHLKLDFAAILGDVTYGPGNYTTAKVKADMAYAKAALSEGLRGLPQMWLRGNHDINYGKGRDRRMTEAELHAYLGSNSTDTVEDPDNIGRNYGYRDFPDKRIRVLYINTTDTLDTPEPATTTNCPTGFFSPEQLTFMIEALKLTGKTDPDKWGIVLLSHYPIMWINEGAKLMTILEAYKGGGSGSVSVTVNGTAETVPYNFSGITPGEIIANLHGHTHNFGFGLMSSASSVTPWLMRVAIPQVMAGRYNESATNSDTSWAQKWGEFDEGGDPVYHYKSANTAKSTSFNVIVIDREQKRVHAITYGAGIDREIDYSGEDITFYSVTNALTNVTNSNGNAQSAAGGAYAATISAVSGYVLDSVTVTMGGTDITASAYSSGSVYIAEVTGDIVITATATAEATAPTYSNNAMASSVDASGNPFNNGLGYMDGKYASGSGEGNDNEFFATGFIPYLVANNATPATIYVKGADWTAESHARFYTYKADKTLCQSSSGTTTFGTDEHPYFKLTVLDEAAKYWKIEPVMSGIDSAAYLNYGQTDFIRLSLRGSGEGVCVSIGEEPIEQN